MPLDREVAETVAAYLAATRVHRKHRSTPQIYTERLFPFFEEVARAHGLPLSIELCYSLSRAPEMLTVGDDRILIYDQYLGQSLSLLNRIYLEQQGRISAIVYSHKIIGEYLRRRSRFSEALVCGLLYTDGRGGLRSRGTADESRTVYTITQETFVLAHEVFHAILEADPAFRERTESKVLRFARDQDEKRRRLFADGTGEQAFQMFRTGPLARWLDKQKAKDFRAAAERQPKWLDRLAASRSLLEEMCCDLHAVNATAAVIWSQVPVAASEIAKAIVLGHYHLRAFRSLETATEWFIRRLEQGGPFPTFSDPPPAEAAGDDHFADLSIRAHHLLFCCSLFWLQRGSPGGGELTDEALFGSRGTYTQLEHLREHYHAGLYDFIEAVRHSALFAGRLAQELERRRQDEEFSILERSILAEASSGQPPAALDRFLGFEQELDANPLLLHRARTS
jgi:hypothetical protein